jgi:hypothetical protein
MSREELTKQGYLTTDGVRGKRFGDFEVVDLGSTTVATLAQVGLDFTPTSSARHEHSAAGDGDCARLAGNVVRSAHQRRRPGSVGAQFAIVFADRALQLYERRRRATAPAQSLRDAARPYYGFQPRRWVV